MGVAVQSDAMSVDGIVSWGEAGIGVAPPKRLWIRHTVRAGSI